MTPKQGAFPATDLVAVPPAPNPVVLKSGGPVMDLVTVEGERALCRWTGWDVASQSNVEHRRLFAVASLLRCVPLTGGEGFPADDPC